MKDGPPASRWSRLPILGALPRVFRAKAANTDVPGGPPSSEIKTYHCGTLTYTKAGLVALFAWLLWGDFCFTLMEAVVPSVLPLNLKPLGAPNWMIGMIMTTLPGILNMTICPWVSFKSDRHRSRWGRRIPFIVWTLPFLCVSLVMLGCSREIASFLQAHAAFLRLVTPATVLIVLIGFFMVVFQFFNMFVASVFWYLFNDVVPAPFVSRFVGAIRMVGYTASGLYQYFIYRYAPTNMREILIGAALVYFVGFGLMCLRVKEGAYPPVEAEEANASRGLRGVKTFLKESFSHDWYRLFFIWSAIVNLWYPIRFTFAVFFNQEMGLTVNQFGKLSAVGTAATVLAMYLAARYIDRWHPLRVQVYVGIFAAFAALSSWIWIFVTLPGNYFFWLSIGTTVIAAFFTALTALCGFPTLTRIFPKSRFGQFCSAQAMLSSVSLIVSGIITGLFLDGIGWLYRHSSHDAYFEYRYNFAWQSLCLFITAALGIRVYTYWHRLGADKGYKAPAPWSPTQTEELDVVPSIGPQSRWLSLALRLFDTIMTLSVLILPVLMWWMHRRGSTIAFRWYAMLVLPYSLAAWIGWKFLERGIRRDMARSLRNEPLHNGIPHHGVLMAISIQYLVALGVWLAQVIVTLKLNMEWECILFGIANVVTNSLLTAGVLIAWRMERGRSTTLDPGDGKPLGGFLGRISGLFGKKPAAETA